MYLVIPLMMVIAACSDETWRGCELNGRGRKRRLVSLRDKLGFRCRVFISGRIVEAVGGGGEIAARCTSCWVR